MTADRRDQDPDAPGPRTADPYSRLDYRRMVRWEKRREREWPLLSEVLGTAPLKRALDLGCGTGEHARLLAEHGWEVVGLDRSETMISKAREAGEPEGVRFVVGELQSVGDLAVTGPFGAAICLGNTLPHLTGEEDLEALATGLARVLAPGAPVLFQLLNYDRVFERGERHLPLNFRRPPEGEEGEVVFLRLMTPRPDGTVLFTPSTLRYTPAAEEPLQVVGSKTVELRGWRRGQLTEALEAAGFGEIRVWGSVDKEAFEPTGSRDLVLAARRSSR